MPQDPVGGGTWVGANNAGLVFALLNAKGARGAAPTPISRGVVIPSLLDCASLEEVGWRLHDLRTDDIAPFRLVVTDRCRTTEFRWPDAAGAQAVVHGSGPLLFTSSSLGDDLVDPPRRALFEATVGASMTPAAAQDDFHAHRWPARPSLSVHMSRPDACTVSTTTIEVTRRSVRMLYHAAHSDDVGVPVGLSIERRAA